MAGWTPEDSELAAIKETIAKFAASTDATIDKRHLPDLCLDVDDDPDGLDEEKVHKAAKQLWGLICNPMQRVACGLPKMTHEMYAKLFQLDRARQAAAFASYALVMLDEAHDCTAAQIDVLAQAPCRKLVVYDPHQAIYQIRHARGRSMRSTPSRRAR